MSDPLVLVANHGAVRTFTLNRPAALNSFTAALHRELLAGLNAAADDASVRCVVITGAGRGFCAGQDLNDEGMGQDGTPRATLEFTARDIQFLGRRGEVEETAGEAPAEPDDLPF